MFFYPNTSAISICDEANITLTCVTDTGVLTWSTSASSERKTFYPTLPIGSSAQLLSSLVTVTLTSKSGLMLTSVAIITSPSALLNGTALTIECADYPLQGNVAETTLITPGIYI